MTVSLKKQKDVGILHRLHWLQTTVIFPFFEHLVREGFISFPPLKSGLSSGFRITTTVVRLPKKEIILNFPKHSSASNV